MNIQQFNVDPRIKEILNHRSGSLYYLKVYCWPNNNQRAKLARKFFDNVQVNVNELEIRENCGFCLINNTWEIAEKKQSHSMVVVLVENHALREAYASLEILDVFRFYGEEKGLEVLKTIDAFEKEVSNELKIFCEESGCPEVEEIENIDLGDGVTVENMGIRLSLPREPKASAVVQGIPLFITREIFTILKGPLIRRLSPKKYKGKSLEEARLAMKNELGDGDITVDEFQDVELDIAEGKGKNVEDATSVAKANLPQDAFDIDTPYEGIKGFFNKASIVRIPYKKPAWVQTQCFEVNMKKIVVNACAMCGKTLEPDSINYACDESGCGWYCSSCVKGVDCPSCGESLKLIMPH
jgi:hypothetical protein